MSSEAEQFLDACIKNDINAVKRLVAKNKRLVTYARGKVSDRSLSYGLLFIIYFVHLPCSYA